MYVIKRHVSSTRVIATLVSIALLLWLSGLHMFAQTAQAANLTSVSDTLSDSAPSSVSDHTIAFTTPNGMAIGENFTVTFPGGFDASSIVIGDIDLTVGGADQSLAGAAGAGTWGVSGLGTNAITFETPSDGGVASSSNLVVYIGTVGPNGGTNQITNPSATSSYEIDISGTMQDSGQLRVAIIENVLVTANVNTSLTFVVQGTSTGTTVNGSPTTTATSTTNTTLPFETLSAGTSKTLAQDLFVTTNAANGFVVTVEQDQNLQSSTGADIDGFIDGAYTDTPSAWTSPSNNIGDENTWGHWGLTSSDTDLVGNGNDFAADQWVAASTTPRAILAHDGPSDGSTLGIGYAQVGYQAEITALQEAGDDYNTTLTYIATPTF